MATCFKVLASLFFLLAAGAVIRAEENAVSELKTRAVELVKQLDHDDFNLREAAAKELFELGPVAAAPVAKATRGESLEAATRAFAILDKWLMGNQPVQQAAARQELEKLAAGGDENSAARRAKALLAKQQAPPNQQPSVAFGRVFAPGMPIPIRGVALGVARMEMRAMAGVAGGAKGRRMSVSVGQGTKTIKVEEDNLNVEIVETEKDGIKIKVTEKVVAKDAKEAKEKTTEYAAKDVAELKEQQPEGFKVYEKYAGALNQLKIKMEVAGGAVEVAPALRIEKAKLQVEMAKERAKLLPKKDLELKAAEEAKPATDPFGDAPAEVPAK